MAKNDRRPDGPQTHPIVPDYPADSFAGTAESYARYRVPYPQDLIDDLRARAGITSDGRLLDLACGTGQVALSMAPYFREVWAVDREPDMVAVGRRAATACGAGNVVWKVGRAEDLAAPAGVFELITIGNAFHRLNRRLVGRKAMEWLGPGGSLAVMGSSSLWTGREDWQSIAIDVVRRWTPEEPTVERRESDQPRETFEEALRFAGFSEIEEHTFPVPYVWSLDAFVGYLYSLSGVSKRVLGNRAEKMEADLRQTLLSYDASGRYSETIAFFVILARRPPTSRNLREPNT